MGPILSNDNISECTLYGINNESFSLGGNSTYDGYESSGQDSTTFDKPGKPLTLSNSNIVAQTCPKVKESQSSKSGNNNNNTASGSTETAGPIESSIAANETSFMNGKAMSSTRNHSDDYSWWHGIRNEAINLKDSTHDLTGHYFDEVGGECPSQDFMNQTRERRNDATWWHGLKSVERMQMGHDSITDHYIDSKGREFPNPDACQKFNNSRKFGLLMSAKEALDDLKKMGKPGKKKVSAQKKKSLPTTNAGDRTKTSKKKVTAKSKVDADKIGDALTKSKKKAAVGKKKEGGSSNKRKEVSSKDQTKKQKKSKVAKNKDLTEKEQAKKEQSDKVNTARRVLLCYIIILMWFN